MKDLTKIYKGPEVLMNCPSLGLEPNGFGSRKFPGFSGKKAGWLFWSLRVPKSSPKKVVVRIGNYGLFWDFS